MIHWKQQHGTVLNEFTVVLGHTHFSSQVTLLFNWCGILSTFYIWLVRFYFSTSISARHQFFGLTKQKLLGGWRWIPLHLPCDCNLWRWNESNVAGTESFITDSKKSGSPCVFLSFSLHGFAICIWVCATTSLISKNFFYLACFESGTAIVVRLNIFG